MNTVSWDAPAMGWLRRLALAVTVAVAAMIIAVSPAQARWLRAEGTHFVVYSDGDERGLRTYVEQLEAFDGFLRRMYDIKGDEVSTRKLPVYLVSGHADIVRAWPGAPLLVGGYYIADVADTYAIALREDTDNGGGGVASEFRENPVFHEYTHHLMFQYFSNAYPSWLTEGFAQYYGSATIEKDTIDIGKLGLGEFQALEVEGWIPLADLLRDRPDFRKEHQTTMFYSEAWLLTHYMLNDPDRQKQLQAYLHDIHAGGDPVTSMTKETGRDLDQLTRDLKAYLSTGKYHRFKRPPAPINRASVKVESMPPSADALLLESLSLERPLRSEDGDAVLASIRAKAAKFPGDRLADLTLSHAEIRFGSRRKGEAILDRRLAADPGDVDALVLAELAGLNDLGADDTHPAALVGKAQSYFAAAYKLDPERYQALWIYARIRRLVDPDYPSDNTLTVLQNALALAPQVVDIRLETARALSMRKQWAEAETVLDPILHDLHNPVASFTAQRLLDRINAERTDKPAASTAPAAQPTGL